MRQAILLSAFALAPTALAAQASPLIGSWSITVAPGMQTEVKGKLTVRMDGDSLIGMLKYEAGEDMPDRPASRLAAKVDTGTVQFVSRRTIDTGQGTGTMVSIYTVRADGDTVKGSLTRQVDSGPTIRSAPQSIIGNRVK